MSGWIDFIIREPERKDWVEADFIPWKKLENATILITGGTGVVGQAIVSLFREVNSRRGLGIKLIILTRKVSRARDVFADAMAADEKSMITFIEGDVCDFPEPDEHIDYIIHAAGETAGKNMTEHAVETINTIVNGTMRILGLARKKHVKGMVNLSSMEVYGHPERGHKLTEIESGAFSPTELRNSYPLAKLTSEALCAGAAVEYAQPVCSIRLAQVFGTKFHPDDRRIMAYIINCIRSGEDIVLKTKGESERSYLYALDAATAIVTVLLKGRAGEIYNAADETTYCSIAHFAETMAKMADINVCFEIEDNEQNGFPKTQYLDMDSGKLRELGWRVLWGEH